MSTQRQILNDALRRDVNLRLRKRLRRCTTAIERIDALYETSPLLVYLTDRSIDLQLQELEQQLGLSPGEIPWQPMRADQPLVDHTPELRARLGRVAAAAGIADLASAPAPSTTATGDQTE